MDSDLESILMEIISNVGIAKSNYIQAIKYYRDGRVEEAEKTISQGTSAYLIGHKAHAKLIQKEASGEKTLSGLLLIHAEDQLMSAETFKILAEEVFSK